MGFKKNSPCNVFLIIVWSIPVLYLGRAEKPHLSEHRAAVVELSTPACNIWHATNPDDCEKGGEIQLCFCEDGMVVGEGMQCEEEGETYLACQKSAQCEPDYVTRLCICEDGMVI